MSLYFVVTMCLAPIPPMDEAEMAKREFERLQGNWRVVERTHTGIKQLPFEFEHMVWTLKGDELTTVAGPDPVAYRLEITLNKDPKWMDWVGLKGRFKSERFVAIYKLNGDTLTVCLAMPNRERPTDFVSDGKKMRTDLMVLKREKTEK